MFDLIIWAHLFAASAVLTHLTGTALVLLILDAVTCTAPRR